MLRDTYTHHRPCKGKSLLGCAQERIKGTTQAQTAP